MTIELKFVNARPLNSSRLLKPAKIGEIVFLDVNVVKYENSIAFTEALFSNLVGDIVAKGTHNIYIVSWKGASMNFDFHN